MNKQIKLQTGVKITYDKKGNIKKLQSPYDSDKTLQTSMEDVMYSEELSKQLRTMFNAINDAYRFGL